MYNTPKIVYAILEKGFSDLVKSSIINGKNNVGRRINKHIFSIRLYFINVFMIKHVIPIVKPKNF
jgi:hypothetical protein